MSEKTIVCISCYYKGYDFMDELKKLGHKVILITSDNLKDKKWPYHAIDDIYYMEEIEPSIWNLDHLVEGFSYLMTLHTVDAVVALDDYDVEKAALIRETFRIPGMGQTTHRYFRDKLAMRQKAKDLGLAVPEFTSIFNDKVISEFIVKVPSPWVLKPRSEASAVGIKKVRSEEELWESIQQLGNNRYKFLLESFKPGDVFHVDSLIYKGEIVFSSASQYIQPPMEISHHGGVFGTRTLAFDSTEYAVLEKFNKDILTGFGLINGATHSEYIRGENGEWYFLETSSRVGGAHIADLIEASSGINIWHEWAHIEDALLTNKPYVCPTPKKLFAGLLIALSKEMYPDTNIVANDFVAKFLPLEYHIGVVYKSENPEDITTSVEQAVKSVTQSVLNIMPPQDKPSA